MTVVPRWLRKTRQPVSWLLPRWARQTPHRRLPDRHAKPTLGVPARWLRVRSDWPRAASFDRAWCRADGEGHPGDRWVARTTAHFDRYRSLRRRGVYDTRWTVLR